MNHDIPLTEHDVLLMKLICIVLLMSTIGIYLYREHVNEKIKS
jgi:hypothetical protein